MILSYSSFSLHRTCAAFLAIAAVAAMPAIAQAAPIATLTASPYGLPTLNGTVLGINLTGDVGTAPVTVNPGANAVTITPSSGGQIVQGSQSNLYAAPVSGGTVANPITVTAPYLSTETGTITLAFNQAQSYLGLLWGSVGTGDLLSFYNGATSVASFSGQDVMNAAGNFNSTNGAQGFGGSDYTLINLTGGTFNKVVLSASNISFEAANFQYSASNQSTPIPEPASLALLSIGLFGLGAMVRRQIAPRA